MKKIWKPFVRMLSVFLAVLLLLEVLPMQVLAAAQSSTPETEILTDAEEETEPQVLYEIEEGRDAYTKVYKKSDQSYTAMVSSTPLHHMQDGKWVDIDNTLTQELRGEETVYVNAENPLGVAFPETLSQENGISLQNGDYCLQFTVEGMQESDAALRPEESTEDLPAGAENLKTQSETAVYTDVLPHTDLEYSVSSTTVKENIVIGKRSAVQSEYRFRITAAGLDAVCTESGEVVFTAPDGTGIFTVPAPFMKDADDAVSTDIEVVLTDNGEGSYSLIYRPSQVWLMAADRHYPVVLDPVVALEDSVWLDSVCVHTQEPDKTFLNENMSMVFSELNFGENDEIIASEAQAELYIKLHMDQLGILTETITPTDVELVLSGQGYNLAAYEITSPLDVSTVTYNTKPQLAADQVIDFYTGMRSVSEIQKVHFNITKIFQQWLSGEKENNGLAIYSYDPALPAFGLFLGERLQSRGITLLIDFVESTGYSDQFNYHTQDIGRAGVSYINDFTQRLLIKRDDIAISGNIMPVNIAFLYNPAIFLKMDQFVRLMTALEEDSVCFPAVYGNGWLTSYNRCLYWDPLTNDSFSYCYAGENGNIVHFSMVEQEDGSYIYPEEASEGSGNGYELFISEDCPDEVSFPGSEYIRLKKSNGEIEQFDESGRLIKIYKEKYPQQSVDIVYVSDGTEDFNFYAIDYITDGVGRKYDFIYNDSGMLQNIQCFTADGTAIKAGTTSSNLQMTYTYDENGNLTKAAFPDSGSASYEYDASGRMTAAISQNMYKLFYAYDDFGRVCRIMEYAQDFSKRSGYTVGNAIAIVPDGPKQVTFSDISGNEETIQFDKYGKTVLVTDARGNYVDSVSGIQRTMSKNLLVNQSFEDDLSGWEYEDLSVSENAAHSGSKSVKFDASGFLQQEITAVDSGSYTFSAYIQAEDGFSVEDSLLMRCAAMDAEGNCVADIIRTVAATSAEFTRYSVVLNVPENAVSVGVAIGSLSGTGVFYVDSVQFEKGSGFGAYNLLDNNALAETAEGAVSSWSSDASYTCTAQTVNTLSCNTVCFPAARNAEYTLSQTVALDGHAGDAISFGGWLKADVISNGNDCRLAQMFPEQTQFLDDRFAGFTLTYTYTTEENGEPVTATETVKKEANDFTSDWQFVEDYVILKGECKEVTLAFEYSKHPAEVCVAMPVLVHETAPEMNEPETQPDFELPEEIQTPNLCVCGEACAYGDGCPCTCADEESCDCAECKGCVCADCTRLGCTCRCESEETCDCLQCKKMFDITYDEFGNLLALSVSGYDMDQLLSMFMQRSFSANGNYMTSATNENGGTVSYAYNEQNGSLLSETDARGSATEYSYNAMGALTQAKTPVSGLSKEALGLVQPTAMTTTYSYLHDRVVSIRHNDFSYYIDYDRWNNIDRVYADTTAAAAGAVLNTAIAKYTYGTGVNHSRLEGVRYGNGDTVHYRYDEYNRVIGISYDGGTTDRFQYGYDALGNVVYIYDAELMRTVLYNEISTEVYHGDVLLYYSSVDADGNQIEYIGGQFVTVTKGTESTRDAETGVTASKKEVSANDVTAELLKSTDAFGRIQQKAAVVRQNSDGEEDAVSPFAATVTDYTYKAAVNNGITAAQGYVDTLQTRVTYGTSMTAENTVKSYGFAYDYDANGNITYEYAVDENGTRTVRYRYTYDEANQLTRVDDHVQGKTRTYQYDKGGNRVSEKIYAYTLSNALGTVEKEIKSEYNYPTWNDCLSKYDGKIVLYDIAGNPISYGNQKYVWNGKQLTEIVNPDDTKTTFAYDADGFRTEKHQYQADGREEYAVYYIWQDGVLTQQYLVYHMAITIRGETRYIDLPFFAEFLYDDSNQPQGCIINGAAVYLFVRNLQGDIIALADQEGSVLIEFSYDPWGRITCTYMGEGEGADDEESLRMLTAIFCPLTYRGYNYDFTTGLYYLQSRYYNPEWGRFLNVDDTSILLATQGETHNANLFAYCNNNPVNNVDPTGMKSKENDGTAILEKILSLIEPFVSVKYFQVNPNDDGFTYSLKLCTSYANFYSALVNAKKINKEVTYIVLALLCDGFIQVKMGRYFLFSVDCMLEEIKWHFERYILSKYLPNDYTNPMDPTGSVAAGIYNGANWLGNYLDEHCKDVDISENDVINKIQAIRFGYNQGIRKIYYGTEADPYMYKGVRSINPVASKDQTEWKRHLKRIGAVRR